MDAHPLRLLVCGEAGDRVGGDDDAPAARQGIDIDDAAGQRHRAEPAAEHRRAVFPARLLGQGEPGGAAGERQRGGAADAATAQQPQRRRGGKGRGGAEPQRRLHGQRKIQRRSGAEADRQPQGKTLGLGRGELGSGKAQPARGAKPVASDRKFRHAPPVQVPRV